MIDPDAYALHTAAATTLLEQANAIAVIVEAPDRISREDADALQQRLRQRGVKNVVTRPGDFRIRTDGLLLAAQVHATLALAAAQPKDPTP